MRKIIQIILFVGLLLNLAQQAESQQKNVPTKILTAEQIAEKYLPSVVLIICDDDKGNFSQGSGFFIREGMILTNHHVIEDMLRGKVRTVSDNNQTKEWWIEKILYSDAKNDIALLSINETDTTKMPVLSLSAMDKSKIGETIYVLSNPKGLSGTISQGIISSGIRKIKDIDLLQIDAPISSGSSGGAVLNSRGEVVGIASGSLSSGQNLNFAVPSLQIKSFLNKYDVISTDKSYDFVQYTGIPNSWKEGEVRKSRPAIKENSNTNVGQNSQKPSVKTEIEKKLTYEEITKRLRQNLQNLSVMKNNVKARINDISFSQCTMNLSVSIQNNDDNYIISEQPDLKFLQIIVGTTNDVGLDVIILMFERKFVETMTFADRTGRASLTDNVFIPIEGEAKTNIYLFDALKKQCGSGNISTANNKPNLKETTDWLTEKVEKTETHGKDVTTKYEHLRFSQCEMALIKINKVGVYKSVENYSSSLKSLLNVSINKIESEEWGVWLKFNKNINVVKESSGYSSKKEDIKKDLIVIFMNGYENNKRVFSAFTRVLELCSEDTKEPF